MEVFLKREAKNSLGHKGFHNELGAFGERDPFKRLNVPQGIDEKVFSVFHGIDIE